MSDIRTFETGATRDTDENKLDIEGCLSPVVLLEFCRYMDKHRNLADGSRRGADDWQAGMPIDVYMKSLMRHVLDLWLHHRDRPDQARESDKDALCAIVFNAFGYLFELLMAEFQLVPVQTAVDTLDYAQDVMAKAASPSLTGPVPAVNPTQGLMGIQNSQITQTQLSHWNQIMNMVKGKN